MTQTLAFLAAMALLLTAAAAFAYDAAWLGVACIAACIGVTLWADPR